MRAVAGVHLQVSPARFGTGTLGKRFEDIHWPCARTEDIGFGRSLACPAQLHPMLEGFDRLHYPPRGYPGNVRFARVWGQGIRRNPPAVAQGSGRLAHASSNVGRLKIEQGLAVARYERIQIDEVPQSLRRPVGNGCGHHATVAVPDEHHISEILELEDGQNVRDVRLQSDLGGGKMHALSDPGVGGGE